MVFWNKNKTDGWYKRKPYRHFDAPLSFEKALTIVSNPQEIAKHSFYPFLTYTQAERKLKRTKLKNKPTQKERPIRYAAHVDGYIYAYYAKKLTELYEQALLKEGLGNCILAYRKGIGSNIEFARCAIEEIKKRKNCVAMTCDISSFYEKLDHAHLKKQWCNLINCEQLPEDHYKIFKSITHYSFVNEAACYKVLGIDGSKKNIKRSRLCSPLEFRGKIRNGGLIEKPFSKSEMRVGIPQGTSISPCLSNIYMLPFDIRMGKAANKIGGYYRRYSDDIIWICDEKYREKVLTFIKNELKKVGEQLLINDNKTTITFFKEAENETLVTNGSKFQYLGFTFDGKNVCIRSSTLSKYWRKVTFGIRKLVSRRNKGKTKKTSLMIRKFYNKYTHQGKCNFISYSRRSHKIMDSRSIKKQIKNHPDTIKRKILHEHNKKEEW